MEMLKVITQYYKASVRTYTRLKWLNKNYEKRLNFRIVNVFSGLVYNYKLCL